MCVCMRRVLSSMCVCVPAVEVAPSWSVCQSVGRVGDGRLGASETSGLAAGGHGSAAALHLTDGCRACLKSSPGE